MSGPEIEDSPLVIARLDSSLPRDKDFWIDPDDIRYDDEGIPQPHFSVQEVAKCFFARSPSWVRHLDRRGKVEGWEDGFFVLDNEPIDPIRTKSGMRVYSLSDIEKMAHALVDNRKIDGTHFERVITVVQVLGREYGVIR